MIAYPRRTPPRKPLKRGKPAGPEEDPREDAGEPPGVEDAEGNRDPVRGRHRHRDEVGGLFHRESARACTDRPVCQRGKPNLTKDIPWDRWLSRQRPPIR